MPSGCWAVSAAAGRRRSGGARHAKGSPDALMRVLWGRMIRAGGGGDMGVIDLRYVHEDLFTMPDDGRRYELLEGDLVVSPSANPRHQRIVKNLIVSLTRWEAVGLGFVYGAPLEVVFDRHTVFEPDVLFIGRERRDIVTDTCVRGAPDLVVEILSDGTRQMDLGRKLKAYGQYGVGEYWVVDPRAGVVHVFRREGQTFAAAEVLGSGATLSHLGMSLSVADILAE